MKNKFFVLFTSVMILASGFTSNVLANDKVEVNVCSVNQNISPRLACCFYPDLVWVSPTVQVCKYCGRVVQS